LYGIEVFRTRTFPQGFDALERDDPASFEAWMTVARTVLHAIPRGLSHEYIAKIIRERIGDSRDGPSDLIIQQSSQIIQNEIFSELKWIGTTRPIDLVVDKLSIDDRDSFVRFGTKFDGYSHLIQDVLMGTKSSPELMELLRRLCRNEGMIAKLESGSPSLYDEIFREPRRTGYGRVRALLERHQANGASYLDAADDVRKSTLFEIVAAGHELVASDGDEFVLLVPNRIGLKGSDRESSEREIEELVEGVLSTFLGNVPARCRVTTRDEW
jgi:hypothetical protein